MAITLKERIRNGETVYGTMVRVQRNPAFCLLARDAGLDFIMFDCEHGIYNLETMHDMFQMADACGITAMLRVPMLDKESISRYLDAGAKGVMVPMTETPEQAKEVVHWSKYPPIGDRGYGTGTGGFYYKTGLETAAAMKEANDRVITIAQIETGLAVENAEEIIATEGIDAVIIGPNDLSVALGIPGKLKDELEISSIRKVAELCRKYDKAFGIHGPEFMQEQCAPYINLCIHTTDADILRLGMKAIKEKMQSYRG